MAARALRIMRGVSRLTGECELRLKKHERKGDAASEHWRSSLLSKCDYPEYREQNRREWVIVSTVLKTGESRFRSLINIVAKMETTNWVRIDEIIKKAKSLK
ncbi:hypothetical protein FI667_g10390, partial [Globisporangium splendens]